MGSHSWGYLEDVEGSSYWWIGGKGHPWYHGGSSLTLKNIPRFFVLISLLEVQPEWWVIYRGTCRIFKTPDWRPGEQNHPGYNGWFLWP